MSLNRFSNFSLLRWCYTFNTILDLRRYALDYQGGDGVMDIELLSSASRIMLNGIHRSCDLIYQLSVGARWDRLI